MTAKLTWAHRVLMCQNGYVIPALPDPGGRLVAGGTSYLAEDGYLAAHGGNAARLAVLINVCKWLRGGRSTGVIRVSSDPALAWWGPDYVLGDPCVGATARAALTSEGFTVEQYAGTNPSAQTSGCDLLIVGSEGTYDATDYVARSAIMQNWVSNLDGAILMLGYSVSVAHCFSVAPFGIGMLGLYFAGPHTPAWMVETAGDPQGTVPVGAMGNAFVAGVSDTWYLHFGLQCFLEPSITGVYPDGIHAFWDFNSAFVIFYGGVTYHGPVWAAYTQHGDLGNPGKPYV